MRPRSGQEARGWIREELQLSDDEYRRTYRDAVQPYIAEPVLAIRVFNRAGGIGRIGMAKVSPLLSMVMSSRAKKQSGDLPTSVIVAVTADKAPRLLLQAHPLDPEDRSGARRVGPARDDGPNGADDDRDASAPQPRGRAGDRARVLKAGGDFNDEAVQTLFQPLS
jgi:hypothetical protein